MADLLDMQTTDVLAASYAGRAAVFYKNPGGAITLILVKRLKAKSPDAGRGELGYAGRVAGAKTRMADGG